MRVIWSDEAVQDIRDIADYVRDHYPTIAVAVEERIHSVTARIDRWPESGRASAKRPGVRVALVDRYPYKIFYRVTTDALVILHIHHATREPWDEQP